MMRTRTRLLAASATAPGQDATQADEPRPIHVGAITVGVCGAVPRKHRGCSVRCADGGR